MSEVYELPEILGSSLGLSRDDAATVELFFYAITPFYEPSSDYHNLYEHICESFVEAMRLCDEAEKAGHQPNRLIVALGLLGHDPGFNHDLFKGFDLARWGTKENYHAYITGTILRSMAVEEEIIQPVEQIIKDTNETAEQTSIEGELLALADVSNVSSRYDNYVLKSCNFFRESVLRGADIDLAIFRVVSAIILRKHFSKIRLLGDIDRDEKGRTPAERAYENIRKFSEASVQEIMEVLGKHAVKFADVLHRKRAGDSTDSTVA